MRKNKQTASTFTNTGLDKATGIIQYRFINDYMFRAILQENKKVLKALISSLLHLHIYDIKSIVIMNPIELGKKIDDKDFILDIVVSLNNSRFINLEMQVTNQLNWSDRSLSYLCRTFDHLESGQDYLEVKPTIHIGFLDFTPFEETPEFYATYQLLNVKNHHHYSDKLTLSVVDLTQIDLATDEDKAWQIDAWAKLFKATTWEEIKMITKKNEYLQEASDTLYTLNADDMIRQQCQARADFYRMQNAIDKKMNELSSELHKATSENQKLSSDIERMKKLLAENGISYPEPSEKNAQ